LLDRQIRTAEEFSATSVATYWTNWGNTP